MTWLLLFFAVHACLGRRDFSGFLFLIYTKFYSFFLIISSTNKYRKTTEQYAYLSITIDNMIITQTHTVARSQIVVKWSEATKQSTDQTTGKQTKKHKQNKTTKTKKAKKKKKKKKKKKEDGGRRVIKVNNYSNVIIILI